MREFLSIKKQKLRIESRVDTQPIWQKRKTCKKRESEFTRNFLNFHSLKKTEKFRKKSREIMRWSDEHRRASFILIFLSHSPRYYLCSYFFSLFIMFCLPYFVFCFVSFFRYHLFWHQAFTTWQWWDNYFSTNSQKPRYFCFVFLFDLILKVLYPISVILWT